MVVNHFLVSPLCLDFDRQPSAKHEALRQKKPSYHLQCRTNQLVPCHRSLFPYCCHSILQGKTFRTCYIRELRDFFLLRWSSLEASPPFLNFVWCSYSRCKFFKQLNKCLWMLPCNWLCVCVKFHHMLAKKEPNYVSLNKYCKHPFHSYWWNSEAYQPLLFS